MNRLVIIALFSLSTQIGFAQLEPLEATWLDVKTKETLLFKPEMPEKNTRVYYNNGKTSTYTLLKILTYNTLNPDSLPTFKVHFPNNPSKIYTITCYIMQMGEHIECENPDGTKQHFNRLSQKADITTAPETLIGNYFDNTFVNINTNEMLLIKPIVPAKTYLIYYSDGEKKFELLQNVEYDPNRIAFKVPNWKNPKEKIVFEMNLTDYGFFGLDCKATGAHFCGEFLENKDPNVAPKTLIPEEGWTGFGKPVIYLYPTQKQEVKVKIHIPLTVTYPEYDDKKGWEVVAYQDGRIENKRDGMEYSYLFWEGNYHSGEGERGWKLDSGFVVEGNKSATFLQQQLRALGLTPKEYNELIVYWFPLIKNNPYNLVHFAISSDKFTNENGAYYEKMANLEISPKPHTSFRIFILFKRLENDIVLPQQYLPVLKREGFTVVEWGGTILHCFNTKLTENKLNRK